MTRFFACLLVLVAGLAPAVSGAQTPPAPADSVARADSVSGSWGYFGGGVSFDIGGEYTRISLTPQLGVNLTRRLSLGANLRYQYINDRRLTVSRESHNYGGGLFSRYRFIPQLYGHLEYSYMSYGFATGRRGVPFLLLGVGYSHSVGKNVSFYGELLVDLIDDEDSPYDTGEPRLNFGIQTGF